MVPKHKAKQRNDLKAACKRMQQLPTLLRQQCWELLRPCWQWCANGCNNSQHCWDLQCIVGRIQPISLCKPCVMSVHGPNNVGGAVLRVVLEEILKNCIFSIHFIYSIHVIKV